MAEMSRATVNLLPRTVAAIETVASLEGCNQTDTVNRAVVLYALVAEALANGGSVTVCRSQDAQPEKLVLL